MEALIRKINCGCVPARRRGSYQVVVGQRVEEGDASLQGPDFENRRMSILIAGHQTRCSPKQKGATEMVRYISSVLFEVLEDLVLICPAHQIPQTPTPCLT